MTTSEALTIQTLRAQLALLQREHDAWRTMAFRLEAQLRDAELALRAVIPSHAKEHSCP